MMKYSTRIHVSGIKNKELDYIHGKKDIYNSLL